MLEVGGEGRWEERRGGRRGERGERDASVIARQDETGA